MEPLNTEVVRLLAYLLPGFVAAAIAYSLTPSPRPSPFERVVQALIYTVLIQVAVLGTRGSLLFLGKKLFVLGVWTEASRLTWSIGFAVVLGIVVAACLNHDTLHRLLRALHITYQTSFSSEWYGVLAQNNGYMVLHLVGQRRLYGWAEEWPNAPKVGHFVMKEAEWLDGTSRIPLLGVERIMISADDVEMIEFMGQVKESENGNG